MCVVDSWLVLRLLCGPLQCREREHHSISLTTRLRLDNVHMFGISERSPWRETVPMAMCLVTSESELFEFHFPTMLFSCSMAGVGGFLHLALQLPGDAQAVPRVTSVVGIRPGDATVSNRARNVSQGKARQGKAMQCPPEMRTFTGLNL